MSTVVATNLKHGGASVPSIVLNSDGTFNMGDAKVEKPVGSAPVFACRAWVNFDGTGTFSPNPSTTKIRASGNVSSITDNGTGDYTVNFTTALPDANYSAVVTTGSSATATGNTPYTGQHSGTGTTSFATTAYRFWSKQGAAVVDADLTSVAVFR
jgi:hypothetical protein